MNMFFFSSDSNPKLENLSRTKGKDIPVVIKGCLINYNFN